jgi:hypothetical protein
MRVRSLADDEPRYSGPLRLRKVARGAAAEDNLSGTYSKGPGLFR